VEDVWTEKRQEVVEMRTVYPMDQHQHGVSEDETRQRPGIWMILLLRDGK